jgi:hypothetical protein
MLLILSTLFCGLTWYFAALMPNILPAGVKSLSALPGRIALTIVFLIAVLLPQAFSVALVV